MWKLVPKREAEVPGLMLVRTPRSRGRQGKLGRPVQQGREGAQGKEALRAKQGREVLRAKQGREALQVKLGKAGLQAKRATLVLRVRQRAEPRVRPVLPVQQALRAPFRTPSPTTFKAAPSNSTRSRNATTPARR